MAGKARETGTASNAHHWIRLQSKEKTNHTQRDRQGLNSSKAGPEHKTWICLRAVGDGEMQTGYAQLGNSKLLPQCDLQFYHPGQERLDRAPLIAGKPRHQAADSLLPAHPQLPPQSPEGSGLGHTQASLLTYGPRFPCTGLSPHIQASLQQPLLRWPPPPCSWSLCQKIARWPCCPRNGRTQRCTVPHRDPPPQHVCHNQGSAQSLGNRTEGKTISKRGQSPAPDTLVKRTSLQ